MGLTGAETGDLDRSGLLASTLELAEAVGLADVETSGFGVIGFALTEGLVTGRVIGGMRGGMGAEGIAEGMVLMGGEGALAVCTTGA